MSMTNTLWATDTSKEHFDQIAARNSPVVSKYRLDADQVQNLIFVAFSQKPRKVTAAKISLKPSVTSDTWKDIKSDPREVLAIALSEADLTHEEIKAMIFKQRNDAPSICPLCQTSVHLNGVMYHNYCDVISWLIKHFFFKYDAELAVLQVESLI